MLPFKLLIILACKNIHTKILDLQNYVCQASKHCKDYFFSQTNKTKSQCNTVLVERNLLNHHKTTLYKTLYLPSEITLKNLTPPINHLDM